MSNNHSHDNIYSILGKLEALKPTAEEKRFALVKEIRESVEAQGSIIAGVDSVQQRLAEQFAKSKIEEKAVSQAQQKFMGMVHAAQKGEKAASPAVAKVAKSMGKKDAKDFAATKHKGLPQHVGEGTCNECGMAEGTCGHSKMEEVKVNPKHELVKKIRARLAQLNDTFYQQKGYEMEPEEAIEQVADEMNISTRQLDKLLQDERFFEEKATTHKGGEVSHKDGVTRHTKKDYPGYQSDDDEDKDDENKGKRGRPRKHAKKADTGEKRGRGRPSKHSTGEKSSKDSLPFSSKNKMGHDPFGRVKPDAEKTVAKKDSKKDSKKTVAENMDNLARRLTEGVNFANLLKEKHQTVDEMLAELSNDMKLFKETGHCSELLRDCMEIKGYHGKMMADEGSEPVQRPSNPDPFAYVKDAPKSPAIGNGIGGKYPPVTKPGQAVKDLTNPFKRTYEEDDSLASELDELAKLAGLSEVSRGEYIKQQDAAAEKSGKDKFNAFGQEFDTDEVNEVSRGEYIKQQDAEAERAGKDKFNAFGQEFDTDEVNEEDLEEAKVDVADAPESVNKPRPKHFNIKSIIDTGDDLHKKKQQYADKPKLGDNPMATLESQLAAEYESIKKVN
jgi:hypothetical protein